MVQGTYTHEVTHIMEDTQAKNIAALEEIIGVTVNGVKRPTQTSQHLRSLGAHWSQHVLEGVYSWILVFVYILGTVISGYPIISGIASGVYSATGSIIPFTRQHPDLAWLVYVLAVSQDFSVECLSRS